MPSNAQQWRVLETDFGCGLSFLQTWAAWQELPQRLIILGGGIEAVEFAHIFAAMGSQVSIISRSEPLLRALDSSVAIRVS